MSKKDLQQTLDAKVFAAYQVTKRKVNFTGSFEVDEDELKDLDPKASYVFTLYGHVDGASLKFGTKDTTGLVKVKLTGLDAFEVYEPIEPLYDLDEPEPVDEPQPEEEEPEEDFEEEPEETAEVVYLPAKDADIPACFGTWEDCEECRECLDAPACQAARGEAEGS